MIEALLILLFAIFVAPILLFISFAWVGFLLSFSFPSYEKRKGPAYCDIDPMNHPAFAWGEDGKGWIQGVDTGLRNIFDDDQQ